MSNIIRKLMLSIFYIAMLFAPAYMITIPFPFATSGVFAIYLSDIFALIAWFYLLIMVISNQTVRKRLFDFSTFIFFSFIGFGVLVTTFRLLNGDRDFDSTIIIRIALMTYWIFLIFKANLIDKEAFEYAYLIFVVLFCGYSFYLAVNYQINEYTFMQNLSTRTTVQVMLFGISSMLYFKKRSKLLSIALCVQVFSLIAASLITGSRINAVMIPMQIFIFVFIIMMNNWKNSIKFMTATLVSIMVVFLMMPGSLRIETGLRRNVIVRGFIDDYKESKVYQLVSSSFFSEDDNSENPSVPSKPTPSDEQLTEEADNSISDSTNARFDIYRRAFDDILSNPLIGPGYRLYDYTYTEIEIKKTVTMPAHNFILEYSLAYGIVGTILFIIYSFAGALQIILNSLFKKKSHIGSNLMFVTTLGIVLLIAMLQPIFVNTVPVFYLYLMCGIHFNLNSFGEHEEQL